MVKIPSFFIYFPKVKIDLNADITSQKDLKGYVLRFFFHLESGVLQKSPNNINAFKIHLYLKVTLNFSLYNVCNKDIKVILILRS